MDRFIVAFDRGLRTLFAEPRSSRPQPGSEAADADLDNTEKKHVAALMRVNHCGEICAQALYSGQSLTARNEHTAQALQQAAREETEHLAWCEQRIRELGGRKSLLNPLWYGGSFALGMASGLLGDKWNLGFLAETERQVGKHLESHLDQLPEDDARSRAVLEQMHADETRHADTAVRHGAAELPRPVKSAMQLASRIMTRTSYYL
ncbi:MAG TPA: 2-polyprenyl-3-methyl-6-methoxy-1,4-benzoquinone monooxygenase [Methylophilaceae bacterium]|nr:2-polyprenyl-3-methyl-6-methoxy-1,4-benzoquinone monooxygenase [Methylophilaceae bacterium]